MDLDLPIVDGWEATRRLKGNAVTSSIPIIALTAHAMAGSREKALAVGCDDFDIKPVDFDRLLAKINQLLAKRR
jgi:CheY-like chemotaxis protein